MCGPDKVCKMKHGRPQCACAPDCSSLPRKLQVCGSDGYTYRDECDLLTAKCRDHPDLEVMYQGKCKSRSGCAPVLLSPVALMSQLCVGQAKGSTDPWALPAHCEPLRCGGRVTLPCCAGMARHVVSPPIWDVECPSFMPTIESVSQGGAVLPRAPAAPRHGTRVCTRCLALAVPRDGRSELAPVRLHPPATPVWHGHPGRDSGAACDAATACQCNGGLASPRAEQ